MLGLRGMEVRVKEMVDYVKDIPEILMSAINETGDQNLVVLDLTNGTKEITGTLYTAGTICGIKQMIYVQVKRNKDGKFYQLCEEEDKLNLFELTTFKALENIQLLSKLLYYSKRDPLFEQLSIELINSPKFQLIDYQNP